MAKYVLHIERIPKVMDFVDVDSDKWRIYAQYHRIPWSWLYRMEAQRLSRYENMVAQQCQHSIFVSKKEAEIFQERNADDAVSVIPNGVDLEYFRPGRSPSLTDNHNIAFTGAMDYTPNIDAVLFFYARIFPLIRISVPDAVFFIIGRNPPRKVRALGSDQNVIVTGTVDDVRPYVLQAKVAIAPLRIARGIQNKVIEAMAMGVPVVGTSNAFQGILATVEDGVAVADDPVTFADEVIKLLRARENWEVRSRKTREYVRRSHVWKTHNARLEALLESLASEKNKEHVARIY
jgi:sugar transferase (PEP-CTERM/EpsH1 system associated)